MYSPRNLYSPWDKSASTGELASNIDQQKATSLVLCSIEKLLRLSYGSAWLVYPHVRFGRFVIVHYAGECQCGRLHKVVPDLLKGADCIPSLCSGLEARDW